MTQRATLEAALTRHGCKPVKTLPSGWVQWSTGDLVRSPEAWFYVGKNGFRFGKLRTSSLDWPRMKAHLLAEQEPIPF